MTKLIAEMLQNKYGKYTISKIIPTLWFVYLLLALTFMFPGTDIPKTYYDLTIIFSSIYLGRSALDKVQETTTK